MVQEAVNPQANVIWGCTIDDSLGDEIRITVIAAGFEGGIPTRRVPIRSFGSTEPKVEPVVAPVVAAATAVAAAPAVEEATRSWFADETVDEPTDADEYFAGFQAAEPSADPTPPTTAINLPIREEDGVYGDDLDIPDFLK
jgi:cell division protein FtsZ